MTDTDNEQSFMEYWEAVDAAMLKAFAIDTSDAGIDADPIASAQEANWTPEEFAQWFGKKHNLTPVPGANTNTTKPATVREAWQMACPECQRDDAIEIVATIRLRLLPDGTDDDGVVADLNNYWDYDSEAECGACGHFGLVKEFRTDLAEEMSQSNDEEG